MVPDVVSKTPFVMHAGVNEFIKMPFGLYNTPATFQRLTETVLKGLLQRICVDYYTLTISW